VLREISYSTETFLMGYEIESHHVKFTYVGIRGKLLCQEVYFCPIFITKTIINYLNTVEIVKETNNLSKYGHRF
jgi:hypothetical protein